MGGVQAQLEPQLVYGCYKSVIKGKTKTIASTFSAAIIQVRKV